MSGRLAPDILARIDIDFRDSGEREAVRARLASLWDEQLNVGPDQLARAILVVAGGSFPELEQVFATGFHGDPRDVIMRAVGMSAAEFAYGAVPFR